MNHGGRIGLLSCAVVLLVVGVICLRQRIGPVNAPPAFVPSSERGAEPRGGTADHPTILSPDPHSEAGVLPAAPWQVPGAGPPSTLFPLPPTYPVNTEVAPPAGGPGNDPAGVPIRLPPGDSQLQAIPQTSIPPAHGEGLSAFPSPTARDVILSDPRPAEATPGPTEGILPVADLPANALRAAVVVTRQNDSLWLISERVYGIGLYYRALFAVNRERIPRPDRIEPGVELVTPSVEQLRRLYPELCPEAS